MEGGRDVHTQAHMPQEKREREKINHVNREHDN